MGHDPDRRRRTHRPRSRLQKSIQPKNLNCRKVIFLRNQRMNDQQQKGIMLLLVFILPVWITWAGMSMPTDRASLGLLLAGTFQGILAFIFRQLGWKTPTNGETKNTSETEKKEDKPLFGQPTQILKFDRTHDKAHAKGKIFIRPFLSKVRSSSHKPP
jgi:hypothetical protein